ncbi:hypothetical protein LIER_01182 [Lithospermum erythrorhizon]|uniref:Uncharacterized protein n=1 Tax=Lithospermum erythrorhizon TaxID=34254 RepID=A0AAV3NK15_LITER
MAVMMSGMSFGSGGTKARGDAGAGKAVEETKEKTNFDLKLEGGGEGVWAAGTEEAENQAFSCANGDVCSWEIVKRASSFYRFSSEKKRPQELLELEVTGVEQIGEAGGSLQICTTDFVGLLLVRRRRKNVVRVILGGEVRG